MNLTQADIERAVASDSLADALEELPVVARCVVEVRSDGTLSIARGIFENEGERVILEGIGRTPRELVSTLARGAFAHARLRIDDALQRVEHKLPAPLLKRIARQA